MTDQELAGQLIASVSYGSLAPGDWLKVSRRARELCGPTPEQMAVIEAAENYVDSTDNAYSRGQRVRDAVRRLRESEQPKPRYEMYRSKTYFSVRAVGGDTIAECYYESDAKRLTALLNAEEAGKEPSK